jgi:hypothetical protein
MTAQIKTKQRVADHGEVLTADREVNAMLDLVRQETERIESRFLEPACGDGNFLAEVLERKLAVVRKRYRRSQFEYERNAVVAVGSLYGIDIQEDNVFACRERLQAIFDREYRDLYGKRLREDCLRSIRFILDRNIVWGDALTLTTVGPNPEPIVFSEWSAVNGVQIKRRDFAFRDLSRQSQGKSGETFGPLQGSLFGEVQQSLFSAQTEPLVSDTGEPAFIPEPVREFPLSPFYRIADVAA